MHLATKSQTKIIEQKPQQTQTTKAPTNPMKNQKSQSSNGKKNPKREGERAIAIPITVVAAALELTHVWVHKARVGCKADVVVARFGFVG